MSPGILLTKIKFHVIRHLIQHVRRFGPAVLFSTERYEAFNRVFRLCSIHSNRQAPSRDIANTFADMDRCRHIVTGGQWFDRTRNKWVQAGKEVLLHLSESILDAKLLVVFLEPRRVPGTVTLYSERVQKENVRPGVWSQTSVGKRGLGSRDGLWLQGKSVTTSVGDSASCGDEVLVRLEEVS